MRLTVAAESWPIAGSFTISRGSKTQADVVVVTVNDGNHTGRGECVPYPRYAETVPGVIAALEDARAAIEAGKAKRADRPVWQLAGLHEPQALVTAYTLSLDTPEAMAEAAARAAHRPLLKLKLGRDGDADRLRRIRAAAPKSRLIVDANEGWSPDTLAVMLRTCADVGVELVEQPLPAGNDEALRHVERPVPVCADESAHDRSGLELLVGKYDAINVKLDKTGGLTEALALARDAQSIGLRIMVGCMLATSLAMAPAMLVAQYADVVDLDGPLLLKQDRNPGIRFEGSLMYPAPSSLWG